MLQDFNEFYRFTLLKRICVHEANCDVMKVKILLGDTRASIELARVEQALERLRKMLDKLNEKTFEN